jgi:hypothetical protein
MAALAHSRPAITWGLDLEEKIGGDSNVMRLSPAELDRLDGDPSFQADPPRALPTCASITACSPTCATRFRTGSWAACS